MATTPVRRGPVQRSAPTATATILVDLPETLRYRMKNALLGPPLVNEELSGERLGRPSALGVLAPDCISSSAYGTEEMLTVLVPAVGLAGFALVVPVTMAILGVLFFVTLSYLDVIKLYTQAGGAYVVARENFGPKVAQVAAVLSQRPTRPSIVAAGGVSAANAAKAIASRIPGNERNALISTTLINRSNQPPMYPASAPIARPITPAPTTTLTLTSIETRVP